jgi:hypothetical protein
VLQMISQILRHQGPSVLSKLTDTPTDRLTYGVVALIAAGLTDLFSNQLNC